MHVFSFLYSFPNLHLLLPAGYNGEELGGWGANFRTSASSAHHTHEGEDGHTGHTTPIMSLQLSNRTPANMAAKGIAIIHLMER